MDRVRRCTRVASNDRRLALSTCARPPYRARSANAPAPRTAWGGHGICRQLGHNCLSRDATGARHCTGPTTVNVDFASWRFAARPPCAIACRLPLERIAGKARGLYREVTAFAPEEVICVRWRATARCSSSISNASVLELQSCRSLSCRNLVGLGSELPFSALRHHRKSAPTLSARTALSRHPTKLLDAAVANQKRAFTANKKRRL